ncbi:SusD/RagB family nutrient-binding outer membrane lipoprotein [Soonwooa sp.]|uniref:SusD/RagB family nutrient-binding outer membrane lipoprotein n=1 Tax=Soonwooa sp. TaxID=1938592 RepID=UPI00289BAB99|nr:SusD/RagB family nutrient-binding outer membrane lipoprotein [Soonwooa sp.]
MKKIFLIVGALTLAYPVFTSCARDFTDLNVDPKHPQTLPSKTFFATAETYLFQQMVDANVNRNISRFFTQQWTETTYTDESNYDMVTRQINTNHWNFFYRNVLNTVKLAKAKVEEESSNTAQAAYDADVKTNMLAQLEIIEIYAWANLVDTYNNIPYSEALKAEPGGTGTLSPKYDDAKTIYTDLIRRLTAVNSSIKVGKIGFSSDISNFKGDMSKWKKLANSLKLRLGVNLSDVDAALAKSTIESAVAAGVIASNADNFTVTYQQGNFSSPLYQNVNVAGSGRQDFVAADTLVDPMNEKNDPRREKYFTKVDGEFVGGVYGDSNEFASFSHVADDIIKPDAVGDIFDYSEVSFLMAEAVQRGFLAGSASSLYNQGIKASMDYWGVESAEADAYIAANPYNAAEWKKSIGEQSWYAMYNRGFEAWTFNRRLDYPAFENPEGSVLSAIPTRMTYPAPEQSLNKTNWLEAVTHLPGGKDVATTKVFWDKN